jgi:predicted membrane GTPase involved in stress response
MVIGENAQAEDIGVNGSREKHLTNVCGAAADQHHRDFRHVPV